MDLEKTPWAFQDGSIDEIFASHVIEHLRNPLSVFKEIHRILKPNGKLTMRVPHFSRGWVHPLHKCSFSYNFPEILDHECVGIGLRVVTKKFKWNHPDLKFNHFAAFMAVCDKVFSFFANLYPIACERIWCYWVGGFDEIEFVFVKGGD